MFTDTTPREGDSDNNLLFKIVQMVQSQCPASRPPMLGDSDNNLLFKWAEALSLCSACEDPAAPSGITASPPNPGSLVEWTDNASNETGYEVRYRNVTQGGEYITDASVGANEEFAAITVFGAIDVDQIEIGVRAINGACASEWVSITVAAEIFN